MSELPDPIQRLNRHFAVATLTHEYVADRCRELVEIHADDESSRGLLSESAAVVLGQMPRLTARLRRLAHEWGEHDLLDPQRAEQTVAQLAATLEQIEPKLSDLHARQSEIAAELTDRVRAARRT